MYIENGIAYAGEPAKVINVCGVRPLADHKLWIRFSNGEAKIFDFTPLLDAPAFQPLRNMDIFRTVYIDYGTLIWDDGNIDISSEYVYENSVCIEQTVSA